MAKDKKPMEDLGYFNVWFNDPPEEVKKCKKMGHRKVRKPTSFRGLSLVECSICRYFYYMDSSD